VVTHTKVNGFPRVNNTKVDSLWALCYWGAWGHTLNILPWSIIHTWLVLAWNTKMNNSRELASIVSHLLLILFRQSSTALLYQCFIQQRIRRRRLLLRFINAIQYSPKIMHAQELHFAAGSRQLLAASCGSLSLEFSKLKNFFAVRSYNRKNVFAIGYSMRKNFFAVGRFKPQEPLCANIVARKEPSVIRSRMR